MVDPVEAWALLDAGENGRLLSLVTPEEVGVAWCDYARRDSEVEGGIEWEDDPDGWAAALVFESEFQANDDFVRRFLLTIVDCALARLRCSPWSVQAPSPSA